MKMLSIYPIWDTLKVVYKDSEVMFHQYVSSHIIISSTVGSDRSVSPQPHYRSVNVDSSS